ncbi:Hypothetical predicted protein [Octopus vulgaris]|uniref:Uncharacterized protein n=1 Tax=Octopus vulgaris TaxID=6645 RepID=A0AA36FI11_OCTVU|nr:Hypothetical predicted protein [Octopus vulgaris]
MMAAEVGVFNSQLRHPTLMSISCSKPYEIATVLLTAQKQCSYKRESICKSVFWTLCNAAELDYVSCSFTMHNKETYSIKLKSLILISTNFRILLNK